jgi:hypothetical protein
MVTGKRYRISFAARAGTGGGPMSIIMQRNSSPWDVHGDADFVVSENWETYSFEFVADATITNNIGIRALLGATANKTFWIDNFQYILLD